MLLCVNASRLRWLQVCMASALFAHEGEAELIDLAAKLVMDVVG